MSGAISNALSELQVPPLLIDSGEADAERASGTAEFVEFAKMARQAFGSATLRSAGGSGPKGWEQPAVYPVDSVLDDWMCFARTQEESADAFLIGSILPICAAFIGRRLWLNWGRRTKYPNLYVMLAGKPGDRKSSVILMAEAIARIILPDNAFLPASFSPESLFDEYCQQAGGRPDKLWVADDANSVLADWQKSANGHRVATRFLELYDCKSISESYRRNKQESADGKSNRRVPETSTSLLYGATFSIAAFPHQEVRAGMARRFIYYVAERHGRIITRPPEHNNRAFRALVKALRPLTKVAGEMDFDAEATNIWDAFQAANRATMDNVNALQEAELSRLSSVPMQVLSVAMIFETCRYATRGGVWDRQIKAATLLKAIEHVEACLSAAGRLDTIANRAEISQDAEVLLAKIRHIFPSVEGFHFLTRSAITKQFCANSTRFGAWRPDDIYLRFIPYLEQRGEARLVNKTGKREIYAFLAEETE